MEVRLAFDAEAVLKLTPEEAATLIDETIAALRSRFPPSRVKRIDTPHGGIQLSLSGPSRLSDEQIRRLGTTPNPSFRLAMTARPEDIGENITAEGEEALDLRKETERALEYVRSAGAGAGAGTIPGADAVQRESIAKYNVLARAEGGPPEGLFFAWEPREEGRAELIALVLEKREDWRFDSGCVDDFYLSYDQNERPALGFNVAAADHDRFEAFTDAHEGQQLAIVLGSDILTRPNLNSALRTGGVITGGRFGFKKSDVEFFVQMLTTKPLPVAMRLVSIERR
ncbi:SecDF P1 head subdomain-containing protein [Planctomycetes bacterium Poly30]|uniref:SecDF P1 head subdomain-containing protein n=1 Tax=Saltatorellus ferox TaxID=2528018 RepID=UPI0011AA62D2